MSNRDQVTTEEERNGYELGFLDGVEYLASVVCSAFFATRDQALAELAVAFNDHLAGCGDPIPEEFAQSFCEALKERGFTLEDPDLHSLVWEWDEVRRRARADLEDAAPLAPDDPHFDENQAVRYAAG